jgi:spore maturation protein B
MEIIKTISSYIIPIILVFASLIILFSKKDYFSSFLDGALNGAKSAVSLLPTMCALIVGVSMLSASGITDYLASLLKPVFSFIGIPTEIITLILTRPISGSASLATFTEIIKTYGADSIAGLCASVIMASSDTVIYVISVYFSSSKIRKTRHALPIALFVSVFCVFLSCIVCNLLF